MLEEYNTDVKKLFNFRWNESSNRHHYEKQRDAANDVIVGSRYQVALPLGCVTWSRYLSRNSVTLPYVILGCVTWSHYRFTSQ
jgi:hypothetical protein